MGAPIRRNREREDEALRLWRDNLGYKAIAERMGVSVHAAHLYEMRGRLRAIEHAKSVACPCCNGTGRKKGAA